MIYLLQVLKMIGKKEHDFFITIFNDLSFELEDLGYKECPEDLINDLLDNHFGIYIEDDRQLKMFTECIMKKQGKMDFIKNLAL